MSVSYEERRARELFAIQLDRAMAKARLTCDDVASRLRNVGCYGWSRDRVRSALDCEIDLKVREMADLAFACGFRFLFGYEPAVAAR